MPVSRDYPISTNTNSMMTRLILLCELRFGHQAKLSSHSSTIKGTHEEKLAFDIFEYVLHSTSSLRI